jgi:hypothetical protein
VATRPPVRSPAPPPHAERRSPRGVHGAYPVGPRRRVCGLGSASEGVWRKHGAAGASPSSATDPSAVCVTPSGGAPPRRVGAASRPRPGRDVVDVVRGDGGAADELLGQPPVHPLSHVPASIAMSHRLSPPPSSVSMTPCSAPSTNQIIFPGAHTSVTRDVPTTGHGSDPRRERCGRGPVCPCPAGRVTVPRAAGACAAARRTPVRVTGPRSQASAP